MSDHDPTHDHADGPREPDDDADLVLDAAWWDARYAERDLVWSGRPNPTLVQLVEDVAPGRALDVACGEGADAAWLAAQGWEVVAVDLSQVAVRRAADQVAAHAAEVADRITFAVGDVVEGRLPAGPFDLVVAHFLHLPADVRDRALASRAALVAPGGLLLDVQHDLRDLEAGLRRPPSPDLFVRPGELAGLLGDGFEVLRDEALPREVEAADGTPATAHDAVLLARRT